MNQNGLLVRPIIPRQPAGTDATFPVPSAAGSNLVQPEIPRQMGGFLPSIMKGVVNSGVIIAPLATLAAHRMMNGTRKRGGGKKEDWARNRGVAREKLSQYGKPSALNINKYAALKRKNESSADDWLTEYILKKRTTKKVTKSIPVKNAIKTPTKKTTEPAVKTAALWNDLVDRAKKNLEKYGKPSGANTRRFASLRKKGENIKNFMTNFKTRKHYVSPPKVKTSKDAYKRNREEATTYLQQFGKPTVVNVSKFVSLKRKGNAINTVVNAVKSRVKPVKPVAVAVSVKPTAKSPPPVESVQNIKKHLVLLQKKLAALEAKKE